MRKAMFCLTLAMAVGMMIGFSIGVVQAGSHELPAIDPADFVSGIDNPYSPMVPGTTFVYEAETEDEFILNEITVTKRKKKILGVTCTVVYDVEWVYVEEEDEWFLTEETYDWYAQDNDGNVWYFGEETYEIIYDDDWIPIDISTEGSWKAGMDGAEPGIIMLADPMPGISYQQEYYEGVAEDMGKVMQLNASVSIEYGDFDNCLKTKEWTPLAPGEIEHKYYAWGVGLVFIEELKEKTVRVELVKVY